MYVFDLFVMRHCCETVFAYLFYLFVVILILLSPGVGKGDYFVAEGLHII